MRKIKSKVFVFFLIFFPISGIYAQKYASASEYMAAISRYHKDITINTWNYVKSSAHSKSGKKIEEKRQELLSTISNAEKNVADLPSYNGDENYKNAVISFLKLNYKVLNEDYGDILNMEEIAEQSYDMMEAYMLAKEKATQKLQNTSEDLEFAQKNFAESYNINLVEGEKSKVEEKLEKASNAMKYYNKIYLVFFKSFKEEIYLLDALNSGNVNSLEQFKNSQISFCSEGLASLKNSGNFKADASLKEACKKVLSFYKSEAEKDVPVFTNFYLKKENFEKMQSAFEKKKESERTQEDVDKFNKAVSEYNEATNNFNTANERLNQQRSILMNEWTKRVEAFMKTHVPS